MNINTLAHPSFKLDEGFLIDYKHKQPEWGPIGYITYKRTYARNICNTCSSYDLVKQDLLSSKIVCGSCGSNTIRSEEFFDTIKRVVEGTMSIQKNHCKLYDRSWSDEKAQRSAQKMFECMWQFKFLPPGRGLWSMGTKHIETVGSMALNNCLAYETPVMTSKGICKIGDLTGEVVEIYDGDLKSISCLFKSYGKQKLNLIHLKPYGIRSNYEFSIRATANHVWPTADGSRVLKLGIGDRLMAKGIEVNKDSEEYNSGLRHGVFFGDGTRHTYYTDRFMIRLCDPATKALQKLLEAAPRYVSTTNVGGDPFITIRSDINLKDLPTNVGAEYICGFIDGWIEADAHIERSGSICLDSINLSAIEWMKEHCAYAGYCITGCNIENSPTNFGPRSAPLNRLTMKHDLVEYIVTSIEKDAEEEVYCTEVKTTNSFLLHGGLITGNCGFISTNRLHENPANPFCFLMDAMMLGVGVGFDTRGADSIDVIEPSLSSLTYCIPDTREGWVNAIRILINSYFPGAYRNPLPAFDYSKIRKEGEPILGFGGTSSGPEPLRELLNNITKTLDRNVGKEITSTTIVDLMNYIGVCVVAGNVRRGAELALGKYDDADFIKLKQDKTALASHRWASNNSVVVEDGIDFEALSKLTASNGEPGYVWLDKMRAFGRLKDPPDNKDHRVMGANPCVEQTLESYELCCLVETFISRHDDLADYLSTLKWAYLYAKTVTLVQTHWWQTNDVMHRNRRIGCSQSGIINAFDKFGKKEIFNWCDKAYQFITGLDIQYSQWLNVPESIKKTSVKPSGTVSLLPPNINPGIHYGISKYYIRRMRIASNSPLLPIIKKCGYPVEKAVAGENTEVISFPIKDNNFRVGESDVSIWEQLENAAQYQYYWADNSVSVTVKVKPSEFNQIPRALELYQNRLKAVSFLPDNAKAYPQMPLEAITKEQYQDMISKIHSENMYDEISKIFIQSDGGKSLFCDSDKCEIR